ncbi:MAG: serine/threonine protein kinase, partial [Candidatus Krumholzibacteria bacterium]|nr:serine/threonine protein kinase [Candidatus Krumholzibacteria bacterium]
MIGQAISHYKILEKLGEGGMGVVYKAEDTKLKRIVALKFLPQEITRDQDAKKRFVHEAQAASALQHNNICTIHEIEETPDGQMFICMDYYDGETLRDKIKRGPLPLAEAIDIANNIAAGLAKAHDAGMVHRDVKPANLVVTSDGVVKVVDFGLAKLAGATRVTKTGTTVGTVAYMSPEQARGEEVDHRSDIFSLGAVFYELLTGELPFKGDHEAAVLYGIANNDPPTLDTYRNDLPAGLQRVIDKALAKDVEHRYPSALEFNDDIGEFREQTGARAGAHSRAGRRRPRWIAPLVAVVVIAIALAVWKFIPNEGGEAEATEHALAVVDFRDLANPDDLQASAGMTELVNIGLIENSPIRVV